MTPKSTRKERRAQLRMYAGTYTTKLNMNGTASDEKGLLSMTEKRERALAFIKLRLHSYNFVFLFYFAKRLSKAF